MKKGYKLISALFLCFIFLYISCSKSSTPAPPSNPCAGITIVVTGSTTATSTPAATNGSINAAASGSTGFAFILNGGVAQSSGTFSGLAVGNYTVTAKNATGCTGTQTFSITATPCPVIALTAGVTQTTTPAATNGAITAIGAGSTGFTYNINGGTFFYSHVHTHVFNG